MNEINASLATMVPEEDCVAAQESYDDLDVGSRAIAGPAHDRWALGGRAPRRLANPVTLSQQLVEPQEAPGDWSSPGGRARELTYLDPGVTLVGPGGLRSRWGARPPDTEHDEFPPSGVSGIAIPRGKVLFTQETIIRIGPSPRRKPHVFVDPELFEDDDA